ncbi:peptidoglycan editing factor PgeF [Halothiobacillus sp. DCM-1]|uniref:peptidoglycan editing factor PgeF n=1 Tax=Halothiobacillus sp. DCM-1 TaxID=3112558 RepID=UPI00325266D9
MCANEPSIGWLAADWPLPPGVQAGTTTRHGGVSHTPFDTLNLATHVGDDPAAVTQNRQRLRAALKLPAEPRWLDQVHGTLVAEDAPAPGECPVADAAYTNQPGEVLAVLTADCLPVVFARTDGQEIAVAHAGWRGLAAGVLESTLARFSAPPGAIQVWLGPAIGARAFEVGDEVRTAFLAVDADSTDAFEPTGTPGKWWADLFWLARRRLARAGISAIFGGGLCTASLREQFYSYRGSGGRCGRMATLVWRSR